MAGPARTMNNVYFSREAGIFLGAFVKKFADFFQAFTALSAKNILRKTNKIACEIFLQSRVVKITIVDKLSNG